MKIRFENEHLYTAIFKRRYDDFLYCAKKALENPKCSISMLKVKIVDLDKFIKGNFRWSDSEGKTNSNEPFKKGDVGYINIVNPEGWGVTNQMIETYEELFGVETFEGDTIDVDVILPLKPNI